MLSALLLLFMQVLQNQKQPSRLHGTVTNVHRAAIANSEVELTDGTKRFSTQSMSDGTFSIDIPPGKYRLSVSADGFCTNVESITSGEQLLREGLPIILVDCSDCSNMTIDFVEPRVEQDQEPPRPVDAHNLVLSYNREELHWKSRSGLDPLVLYGRREERGSFIRYTGLDCPGKARPATLQYYGGIIQATTLAVNQIEHRIEGLGEVTLVNRHGLQHGAHAEVTLAADGSASALILK